MKTIFGSITNGSVPIHSAGGSILYTGKKAITDHWAEHFSSLLNCPSAILEADIGSITQFLVHKELAKLPSIIETEASIK